MKLLYHPSVLLHDTGAHPENRKRLEAFGDQLVPEPVRPDGEPYLELVHPRSYVDLVRKRCSRGDMLDADTQTSIGTFEAAATAVGATLLAMERRDFAMVRPPGHHAYADEGHGFCIFNNVAIAAQKAVSEGKRVLILDIDGHLGDGTMDIFYNTDKVMYWSIHQYPAYPGNGSPDEIGDGKGKGYTINVPLPSGSGDDILLHSIDYMLPAAVQFQPDVVAVSAGFDAHQFDPMLQLRASGNFYYKVARILVETFPGKVFAVLEGGYNTEELAGCVLNFLTGANGEPMAHPETSTSSGLRTWETYELYLHQAAGLLMKYWKF